MSEYFRVLQRLENQAAPRPGRAPVALRSVARPLPERVDEIDPQPSSPMEPSLPARTVRPVSINPVDRAFDALVQALRPSTTNETGSRIVLAAAGNDRGLSTIVNGLCRRAAHVGLRVQRARVVGASHESAPQERSADPGTLTLDFQDPGWADTFARWHHDQISDVLLIEAEPLGPTNNAALLARTCDGLVLVAQRSVTQRDALELAASQARATGCVLLGVILHAPRPARPRWLSRHLGIHTQGA